MMHFRGVPFKLPPEIKRPTSARQTLFGLDLGKIRDHAALVHFDALEADGPTIGSRWCEFKRYHCQAAKRYQLGIDYTKLIDSIKETLDQERWVNAVLIVDATGVGQPVIDYIRRTKIKARVVPVTITGGNSQRVDAAGQWWVAKAVLVSNAKIMLQTRELILAKSPLLGLLFDEMRNYATAVTGSGNEVFGAREGEHDDLVMALCLAAWWATRARRRIKIKT